MEKNEPISQIPNIGKEIAEKLIQVGITTPEELYVIGTEKTFIRLFTIDKKACLSKLQAIEGAIQGIRWHNLPNGRKEELKEFFYLCRIKETGDPNFMPI